VTAARLGPAPRRLVVAGGIAAAFLLLPLLSLVLATPWRDFPRLVATTAVRDALLITLVASLGAVAACLVLGTPLAWLLARVDFPGRSLLRALVTVPLVLPPVVAGVALTTALGRHGLLGGPLREALGLTIPFTTVGVVVAHTFASLPFYVLAVEGALRATGGRYDVVAATLGADRWTAFRRVTLPLVLPGISAGAVLAWARSLGEFGATITFAGNYPGTTQTMPSLVYAALQSDPGTARALSMVLLVVSVAVLGLLRNRWLVRA
jgi:molybdate transport system permease protein